jgi:TolA-binding protein
MKFTLPSLLAVAVLAGLFHHPKPALAQSKEIIAIGELQRQNYTLDHKLDDLKSAQDSRTAQLETLIKQLMEANAKLSSELQALQETTRRNQTEQQTRLFEPMQVVKQGMDDMSLSISAIQSHLNAADNRQKEMESKLTNIDGTTRLILKQLDSVPQPAPAVAGAPASDTAALLFSSAQSDKLEGKLEAALGKFNEISQKYPEAPEAPKAVFEMGSIYAQNGQYDDAVKAFDRVLEQFGDNPMRKPAQFMKAEQLASQGRRPEAAKEFTSFAKQYPGDEKAPEALSRARELNAPAPNTGKSKQAKGRTK